MDKNQKMILIELMNHDYVSGTDLSTVIQMSTRSVRTIIKNIIDDIKGAKIESGTYGYKLLIEDYEQFLEYLQQEEQTQTEETRLNYLFDSFMNSKDYLKIDDLCEELYLSRTQLKQTLKELRAFFLEYHVSIETKAHYGLYIEGQEVDKRRAIAHFEGFKKRQDDYIKIKSIVLSCIVNGDFVLSDDNLENIITYLYIAFIRVEQKNYIEIKQDWLNKIQEEKEYSLATSIMMLMNHIMNMEYREEETAYMTMHLCGKNSKQYSHIAINQEVFDLVSRLLKTIENISKVNFTSDLNLQLSLALHIIPLLKRIEYKTYMKNPLIHEIKSKLIRAYELAIEVCKIINQSYNCCLSDDEIGYFALHINLSLEQKLSHIHKKDILLVCSSGVGSARLLEYFFKENFKSYINNLDVCSLYELENINYLDYDCIFTTIPLEQKLPIPIILIKNLLNQKEVSKISDSFKQLNQIDVMQYFPERLFFQYESFNNKEEAIYEIVKRCREEYDLPNDFEQHVLQREELATTEFTDLVAFPHTNIPMYSKTFVSVTILKKPLLWKNKKIRMIFLSSIESKVVKELDHFYSVISTLISNPTIQWQIVNNGTYQFLKESIERIEKT